MKPVSCATVVAAGILATAATALGHHSPAAYDVRPEARIVLEGTVTRVSWANPHVYFYIETDSDIGSGRSWQIEVDAPSNLQRHGWYRDSLVTGDRVQAEVFPARNRGDLIAKLYSARMPDGTSLSYIEGDNLDLEAPRSQRAEGIAGIWAPDPLPPESPVIYLQEQLIRASYGLDADVPLTAAGLAAMQGFTDADSPTVNCVPRTAPSTTMYSSGLHSIEVRDDAVILRENWFGTERRVSLVPEPGEDVRFSLQGHAVGRFDGATLIVESSRFTPHREGLFNKLPSSRGKRLTENFELNDDRRSLTYRWEVSDPQYLAEPVRGESHWTFRPDLEFALAECSLESAQQFLND